MRRLLVIGGSLSVLGLMCLAVFAPPDGQERAQLAQFFGGFHLLAVHLPIALLLLVPVLEFATTRARWRHLSDAVGLVLGLAAISAIVTPALGWLLARSGGFEGGFVTQHMWGGIGVAAAALSSWILRGRGSRVAGAALPRAYIGMISLTVLLVAFTGYRGGQLAHGENHLTEHLPLELQAWLGVAPQKGAASDVPADTFYAARVAPIFEQHCVVCHSANKHKGGLTLSSYKGVMAGGKDGVVIKPGDAKGSDLLRRVSLDPADKDAMPAEGKPPLNDEDRKILALWIDAGASATTPIAGIAGAPKMQGPAEVLAPDYRPMQQKIAEIASTLNIRLLPRSRNPTDGLVLRTASSPQTCDDAVLSKLAPFAPYIVDAELARTKVTDAGARTLVEFKNLRWIDLSNTAVTSAGARELVKLTRLETLNVTDTAVDDGAVTALHEQKNLKHVYVFK